MTLSERENGSRNVSLDQANRLYITEVFPPSEDYLQTLRDIFDAEAEAIDFKGMYLVALNWIHRFRKRSPSVLIIGSCRNLPDNVKAREEINEFVSERTRGLIPELLREAPEKETVIAMVSCLFFRGGWKHELERKKSERRFNAHVRLSVIPTLHQSRRLTIE